MPTPKSIARCENCPPKGGPCKPCERRHRNALRRKRATEKGISVAQDAGVKLVERCSKCPPIGPRCWACLGRPEPKNPGKGKAVKRCPQCPPKGPRCLECFPREAYRVRPSASTRKTSGFHRNPLAPLSAGKLPHVQPSRPEPNPDLFSCPGCMRKLRGEWRFCDRCKAAGRGRA